jgi:nicotinate phosphoribosyltransferase
MNSFHNDVLHPILTDYYQITMAYSYYKMGKHNEDSVFESFFRKAPFNGEYLIFCGVGEVVKFV